MSQSVLFATWLNDLMNARKISADQLQYDLNYKTSMYVRAWLDGRSRPQLCELPALAKLFNVDPVEMIAGWVIDQVPEMEKQFRTEILAPRGSTFPRSDDLALRAPRPSKPVALW
jgi:hypothetical protein